MKIKFLLLSVITPLVFGLTTHAQVNTDLQLTILTPTEGEIVPYGDTTKLILTIKNLGPETIIGDTLALKLDGAAFTTLIRDTIEVGDSVNVHMLSAWNTGEEDSPFDVCVFLDFSVFGTVIDAVSSNDTACVSAVLKGSGGTGLSNIQGSVQCNIYPNPVSNLLHITLPADVSIYSYSLLDYTGKVIVEGGTPSISEGIDVSRLPPGLYLLNIITDKGSVIQKVTIRH